VLALGSGEREWTWRSEMGMRHVRRGGSGSPVLSRAAIEKAASICSGTTTTTSSSSATASTYGETISDNGGERLIINAQGMATSYSAVPTVRGRRGREDSECTGPTDKILACSLCVQDIEGSRFEVSCTEVPLNHHTKYYCCRYGYLLRYELQCVTKLSSIASTA
jgi:hypothetical protein